MWKAFSLIGFVLCFLASVAAALSVPSSLPATGSNTLPKINVLALGDSITYGFLYVKAESPQPAGWPKKDGAYPMAYAGKIDVDDWRASYRLPLYQLLFRQKDIYDFAFVGNVYSDNHLPEGKSYGNFAGYPGSTPDPSYPLPPNPQVSLAFVGWPGKTTADVDGNHPLWGIGPALNNLTGDKVPTVALIHLGTNDINKQLSSLETQIALAGILTKLKAKNPAIIVYIAQIIPVAYPGRYCDDDPSTAPGPTNPFPQSNLITFAADCTHFYHDWGNDSATDAFNQQLIDWCGPVIKTDSGSITSSYVGACTFPYQPTLRDLVVYLVDQEVGFDSENWLLPGDQVHPSRHGECRIAVRWYEALRETAYPELPETPATFCDAYSEDFIPSATPTLSATPVSSRTPTPTTVPPTPSGTIIPSLTPEKPNNNLYLPFI